jgi:hypothetical protein
MTENWVLSVVWNAHTLHHPARRIISARGGNPATLRDDKTGLKAVARIGGAFDSVAVTDAGGGQSIGRPSLELWPAADATCARLC